MKKDYFIQTVVLPFFTFKIRTINDDILEKYKLNTFNFTSLYSLIAIKKKVEKPDFSAKVTNNEDVVQELYKKFFTLDDPLVICMTYIHMYTGQNKLLLEDRLQKKTRNLKVINQYSTIFEIPSNKELYAYSELIKFTRDEIKYKTESYFKKKAICEILDNMKQPLEAYMKELKKELNLNFKSHDESTENVALVGLVSKYNKVMLAIASQDSSSVNISVLFEPKKFVSLIENVEKPVILEDYKELNRTKQQQAASQILAYFIPSKGILRVIQGVQGVAISNEDDIIRQDKFKVDIDLLLTYYKVLKFELENKERFDVLMYGSEIFSNEFIIKEV